MEQFAGATNAEMNVVHLGGKLEDERVSAASTPTSAENTTPAPTTSAVTT
jgi:hypothetical protein